MGMATIVDALGKPEPEKERRRCAFCDYRGKLTREHVWPERFNNIIKVTGKTGYQRGDVRSAPETWEADAFSTTVRIDCGNCNHHVLRQIEDDAIIPYIAPMLFGQSGAGLHLTAQRKIAAFALRMFAVSQYTHPRHRPIPRHHREYLVTHRSPPPLTEVWVWMCVPGNNDAILPDIFCASVAVSGKGERFSGRVNSYHGILRIANLVIEIASRTDGLAYPVVPDAPGAYLRIWPMLDFNRVYIWPPLRPLTEADYQTRVRGCVQAFDMS
jgi:hypothetical protein